MTLVSAASSQLLPGASAMPFFLAALSLPGPVGRILTSHHYQLVSSETEVSKS